MMTPKHSCQEDQAACVLRTMDWPPQSLDFTITECVWN
uniref:Uncharacterized protein n=1 Tax=Anguilla anguilla TaxID=7936 RepID=A0A0E9V7R3_ANGAN